jgi:putative nucleotidyltransferase with HDIG domain
MMEGTNATAMTDTDHAAICDLFPAVGYIRDEKLELRTLDVWATALERTERDPTNVDQVPASLQLKGTGIGLASHTRAVTDVALSTVEAYDQYYPADVASPNRDHVVAGGLLHDVGKLVEYAEGVSGWEKSDFGEYVRHPFTGVALCDASGIPATVQHIVAVHSHEGDGVERTLEASIVHHADFLNFLPLR